ncbi:MAG TPA: molybdopterin-dependent oxidoreductase [Albitalea sp.]|uniref:molybdopterin-dependent oxidoreductase n=1 Tax=Piscinibacter sp. TaxID=1903157 RepID=UPI002ED2DE74
MNPVATASRRAFVCALAGLAAGSSTALEAPAGRVVLTISGEIEVRNSPEGAHFDMAMLEKLPQHSFSTRTPWFPEPRKFTGVLLRDLLASVGAHGRTAKAVALNDYRVDIPVDEAARHEVMVAYRLDDKPMAVRDKGPLVVIYPFDSQPGLRSAVHYGRAAWQLRQIELR